MVGVVSSCCVVKECFGEVVRVVLVVVRVVKVVVRVVVLWSCEGGCRLCKGSEG